MFNLYLGLLLSPQTVPVKKTRDENRIADVWTGSLATFLKSNSGAVYAFGLNNFGQLGECVKIFHHVILYFNLYFC